MVKNLPAKQGTRISIPGSGRSPGEGNGNALQYSCLGNPRDRGAWCAWGCKTMEHDVWLNNNSRYSLFTEEELRHTQRLYINHLRTELVNSRTRIEP